jgi:2-dehydropantoate 2-reductase
MKIAILGAGAMGSLYGGFLARQMENKVTLINTRRDHIEAINSKGLTINTPEGDLVIKNLTAVTSPAGLGVHDLVIVFVKATATEEATRRAVNLVGPETIVLTLQNGLGNIEKLCRVVDPKHVVGGINSYGSAVKGPGEIVLRGFGETVFGEIDGSVSERLKNLKDVFDKASLPAKISANINGVVWTKLITNIGINALCAILDVKNGQLLQHPEAEALVEAAIREALAVAQAMGVVLETDDPLAHAKKVIQNTGENICSMLQDIRAKRQTEIAVINGAIVESGAKYGVPTPINMVLTNLIKVIQRGYSA